MEPHIERIGIYGGTFSPIHSGHVRAAYAFLNTMNLDRLYVVPNSLPPHKTNVDGAGAADRLEMARLAFDGISDDLRGRLEVSDFEIRREGKSFSFYTLEHFSRPDRELFILVGTDMFLTLNEWFRSEDVFRLARIVLMRREREESLLPVIKEKRLEYTEKYNAIIYTIDAPPIEISSTLLRGMIRAGESVAGLIPDNVIKYIKEKSLYR